MPTIAPCLIHSHDPSGGPVVRLGVPLLDDYLEFLSGQEVLTGLQKLADALLKHSLGFRLIIIGFGLVLVGGIIGGVSGL